MAERLTLKEIQAIKEAPSNSRRDSRYCPKCHTKHGASIGCHAHTTRQAFTWWRCTNCGYLYDRCTFEMAEPYKDGFGLDEPKYNKRR